MKLTKKILSLFLACLMVFSTVSVAQAAVVDTVSSQVSSKAETVNVSKSNGVLNIVDGFKPNEMFERVSSTLKNIEVKNPFTAIKSLDFDTTKISANLAKQLDEGESGFERLMAAVKVGFNNAKLYVNNFIALSSEVITQVEEAGSSEVEYGVSSTYTATIPGYILATAPGDDLNVYTVTAENVVIPLKTELAVTILKDGQMVHKDDKDATLEYNMYKVAQKEGEADKKVENVRDRLFKVPAGFTEGSSADIYATVSDSDIRYAGVYEEETVVFNLKVTDMSFTDEELENNELIFKIGKTKPEYVLAEFNDDYTSVEIFASGTFSDGLMMDWTEADASNPFYAHRDTLKEIIFTGSLTQLTSIGANAFNGCEKIEGEIKIPSNVTLIGTNAFANCYGITNVVFTSVDVPQVRRFSFARSVPLTPEKPVVYENASVIVGSGAFENCTGITNVELGNNVKELKSNVFAGCIGLTEFNSGASCEVIGCAAFKDCVNIGEFVLPNVKSIGYGAFENTKEAATVILQAPRFEFVGSMPIETIIIEDGVTSVGSFAFAYTEGMEEAENGEESSSTLKKVVLGKDVEKIGDAAFMLNSNVVFEISEDNDYLVYEGGLLKSKDGKSVYMATSEFQGAFVGDKVLENISAGAFANTKVTDVTLPESVKYIPLYAFAFCSELKSLSAPGAMSFGVAFLYGTRIETLELSVNLPIVTDIERAMYAFDGIFSEGITLRVVGSGGAPYYSFADYLTMGESDSGEESYPLYAVLCMTVPVKEIEIGDDVTYISDLMFAYMDEEIPDTLETVKLGKTLNSIGSSAFFGRNNIKNIIVPEDNDNLVLEDGIIYDAEQTKPMLMTSLTPEIITFPESVAEIPACFGIMSNATTVILGENITSVGAWAFYYTPYLKKVEVHNNETEFELMSFRNDTFDLYAEADSTAVSYATLLNEEYDCDIVITGTLCKHENSEKHDKVEATCTTVGYTAGVYCPDCESWIKGHEKIVKTHEDKNKDGICEICNKIANDVELGLTRSFDCERWDYYNESENLIDCYKWVRYSPQFSGVYTITVHDTNVDSSGDGNERTDMMILKTEDVYSLDINDEQAVEEAYICSNDGYKITESVELEVGQTYWIGLRFHYGDRGSITVGMDSDDCPHEKQTVIREATPVIDCSDKNCGKSELIQCELCRKVITEDIKTYNKHTNENFDNKCDICGDTLSDISIGETFDYKTTEENPKWVKFTAPVTSVYELKVGYGYDTYTKVYARDKITLIYDDTSTDSVANVSLEAGETYYIQLAPRYSSSSDSFVINMPLCTHLHKLEEGTAIEPVRCDQPGVWNKVTCLDCNKVIHNGEPKELSHIDNNVDGVCDVCDLHTADYIVKGSSDRWYKIHATTDGVYLFSDGEWRDGDLLDNDNAELELWNLDKDVLISKETGFDRIEVELSGNTNYYLRVVGYISSSGPQYKIVECYHNHTRVDKEAVTPERCGQVGTTGIVWCRDCKSFIFNDDILEIPHTDRDKDYVCDVCSHNILKLPINESFDATIKNSSYTWFEFVPTIDGAYRFNAMGYVSVVVYCDNKLVDSGYDVTNKVFELEEDKTYHIGFLSPSQVSQTVELKVTLLNCEHIHQRVDKLPTKATACNNPGRAGIVFCVDCCTYLTNDEITETMPHVDKNSDGKCDSCKETLSDIVPGQTKTIEVVAGKVTYLKFIPTETASYTFRSIAGNGDTYGYLYDENKNILTYNDDGGGNSQFKITYTLEAGKTYYWGARFYNTSTSGSFSVSLTQN